MPHFMFQATYSSDALSGLTKNPENRTEVIKRLIDSVGGRLESVYYCFGEYDAVCIFEAPDNSSAAALAIATGASGALATSKTTPLLTADEAREAMALAAGVNYAPPG
jgi:uncharacterized protein with GYD domain